VLFFLALSGIFKGLEFALPDNDKIKGAAHEII